MSRLPELAPAALSFQFLAEIASGATTRIDLCRSVGPHRPGELLAVKRLHPHFAEDPTVATRFLDEVWMTAALKHANVVEVAGWGNDEHGNYLAVELVQGVSLARLMKTVFDTGEAFPERLIVHVVAQICRGLVAAHGVRSRDGTLLNLVHRDLTPGNVLIGFKGEVKIADFGLAKSALRMTRTLSGTLKGEPSYMAPEQARGTSVDHRSDLFSLGVILFELFAGKHPWSAATDYEMVKMVATRQPVDLRELRPKIDKELVTIVMRCLEKDPAARFQSADEVHTRLDAWLRGHGYLQGSEEALGRFVRRNAMRQMRWFERAVAGTIAGPAETLRAVMAPLTGAQPAVSFEAMARGGTIPLEVGLAPGSMGGPDLGDDATDFDAQVGSFHPPPIIKPIAPTIREAATVDENSQAEERPAYEVVDELPTIVKGDLRALLNSELKGAGGDLAAAGSAAEPRAAGGADRGRSRGPRPSYYSIAEEDSDQRTTSVTPPPRFGGPAIARGPAGQPLVAPDGESGEMPTVPLTAPGGESKSSPPAKPPVFEPHGRKKQPLDTNLTLPAAPLLPYDGTLLPPYDGAPRAPRDDELDPERAAQVEERLHGEADRLKTEAARLREEARVAVAQAERRVAMANVAAHLAAMAAEALQFSVSSGGTRATRHLAEALTLEQAMHRVAATPLALPPDAGVGPISAGREQEDMLAQLGLAHLASPSMTSMPHPSSRPPRPMSSRPPPPRSVRSGPGSGPSYPRSGGPGSSNFSQAGNPPQSGTTLPTASFPGAPPLPDFSGTVRMGTIPLTSLEAVGAAGYGRPYMPNEGGAGHPGHDGAMLPPSSAVLLGHAVPPGAVGSKLDGLRFQADVQRMFLGVPRNVAFAIAAGAFTVVLVLLWLFFS